MHLQIIKYNSDDYKKSVELRDIVLRKPLGLVFTEEFLAQDETQIHIGAFENEVLLGILILKPIDDKTLKMRQVAVQPDLQKSGIGKKLVEFSEKFATENGYNRIELHARDIAIPFYEKLSYITVGETFSEVGIPHKMMYKKLN